MRRGELVNVYDGSDAGHVQTTSTSDNIHLTGKILGIF
jgi:hypothetical protein